jgi:hypothetical protein
MEDGEERVQKNRRQLQEQIQIKNDNLSIIFQKISKLEYFSNACACPDLAEESKIKVSFLYHDAALICGEIDRMQRELNDVEYAIRTFIDVEVSPEQKQNQKYSNLGNFKDISMIELSGGGKRKKKSALPDNQTLINGFFTVDGINIAANEMVQHGTDTGDVSKATISVDAGAYISGFASCITLVNVRTPHFSIMARNTQKKLLSIL